MITKEEYESARETRDKAEATIRAYNVQQAELFRERMKSNPVFAPHELIYSASARCRGCGAGLAYPKDCGPNHYWDCGAVLLGEVKNPGKEHVQFPFSSYEIKSDQQPSAGGATTRPAGKEKE